MRRLALALLLLVACSDNPPLVDESSDVQWKQIGIFVSVARFDVDGADCVAIYYTNKGVGISCDWSEG